MAIASDSTFAPESGAHHCSRRFIEQHIEAMIALLDEVDDDPDLEPDSDHEPYLAQTGQTWMGSDDDRELDCDSDEADTNRGLTVDDEPRLGAPDSMVDQIRAWAMPATLDDEDEDGGDREPEEQDGEGEFSGGCLVSVEEPEINATEPSLWRRA